MKFKTGDKVRITKPDFLDQRITDWVSSMDYWDGEVVTLRAGNSVSRSWTVNECTWDFDEDWMTLSFSSKFKIGYIVLLKRPEVNKTTPLWLEDEQMDWFHLRKVILFEESGMFSNTWKVKDFLTKEISIYSFQESWMTLMKNPETKKEEKTPKVEKKMLKDFEKPVVESSERIGPAVKTNDFPTWESHETTNPALHMLYVHWALYSLRDLKSCLRKLNKSSQGTMIPAKQALQRQIQKLVETDPAYRHAAALLFAGVQPLPRNANDPRYPLISEVEESEIKAKNMPKCGCTGTFYSIVTEGVPTIKCFGCYGTPENAEKVSDKYKCPCGMSECCKNLLKDSKDKCDCGMPDGSCVA